MSQVRAVKRRINRLMKEVDGLSRQLAALSDELPVPARAEVEEMLAGRRPFTYEALLVGLLGCIQFHLAEATVSLWGEGYSRYTPSTFNGQVSDPHILQGLRNAVERRAGIGENRWEGSTVPSEETKRFTSEDLHRALFEVPPEPRKLEELEEAARLHFDSFLGLGLRAAQNPRPKFESDDDLW